MSTPQISLYFLPSLCQKFSELVEIWQSYDKNSFVQFFETRCSVHLITHVFVDVLSEQGQKHQHSNHVFFTPPCLNVRQQYKDLWPISCSITRQVVGLSLPTTAQQLQAMSTTAVHSVQPVMTTTTSPPSKTLQLVSQLHTTSNVDCTRTSLLAEFHNRDFVGFHFDSLQSRIGFCWLRLLCRLMCFEAKYIVNINRIYKSGFRWMPKLFPAVICNFDFRFAQNCSGTLCRLAGAQCTPNPRPNQ